MRVGVAIFALASIMAAQDPVKQARQALEAGEQSAVKAGQACKDNEFEECQSLLKQTEESVVSAKVSLEKSGINPSKSPRHYKDAEIRTRKILRIVRAVESYIHPDDRNLFESVVGRISKVNDQLLSAIMSKKKK